MTAFTLTYSKTTFHRTTILANSKEDFLGKAAKLIFDQEITNPIEKFTLYDQDLKIKTEHVAIEDVTYDEDYE